jgi:hypothetical protein
VRVQYITPPAKTLPDGSHVDMGVEISREGYPVGHPLAHATSVAEIEAHSFPDRDAFDYETAASYEEGDRELLWLPAYAGHEHDLLEKVWWRLKGQVAASRLHGSIDALVDAVHAFFASPHT